MIATHRRRIELLAVATSAVVLVAIGTVAVLWSVRDRPGPRSLEDALAEFREGDSSAIESIGAVVGRPTSGVYTATGTGRASIDFPPTSQSYGTTIPVIVRLEEDGCWTTEVDFNVAFRQTWRYCLVDGDVFEHANRTSTRWDLGVATIDEHAEFVCDPPGAIIRTGERQAEASTYTCTGTSDSISGTTDSSVEFSMIGADIVAVGGTPVPTFHYREVDTLTGTQRGTTTIDFWYGIDSFLLVRMDRSIGLRTASPVGTVTYSETGSWQLQSLEPQR